MKRFSLRYTLLTYRLDQLWLPASFWVLFAIISLFREQSYYITDMTRYYIGIVIPLVGGIMAAYAILDDPALELRFTSPTRSVRFLGERLGIVFIIQAISALSFQGFAFAMQADFSALYNLLDLQLAWFIPTLALISLGSAISLFAKQPITGALLTGLIWLFEILARSWLAESNGKYFLVFMGALMPEHPALLHNQTALIGQAIILLFVSLLLLRRQERYI